MEASSLPSDIFAASSRVVEAVGGMPGVVGITLGGSAGSGLADAASDIDLHVYTRGPLAPDAERAERLRRCADPGSVEAGVRSWGLEDHLRVGGRDVELIYVSLDDLLADVERAYGEGLDGEGFVTAQFFYLAHGHLLHDPSGEVARLRDSLRAAYPEPTRQALLRSNPELLRVYLAQLRKAQARGDVLFVQHRRYTIQMVFFNLLFALNRRYHPGEKRLLIHGERCELRPLRMAERWSHTARLPTDDPALLDALDSLAGDLCDLVEANQ